MMLDVSTQCSGCAACVNACDGHLQMESDAEGFLYPSLNGSCHQCGQCEIVCPLSTPIQRGEKNVQVFAAKHVSDEVRLNSTSGGVFYSLAHHVLSRGGCVTGARFDSQWNVHHECVYGVAGLPPLLTSKYVQSEIKHVFRQILAELANGRVALFCGTPCQVAGLLGFVHKPWDNLITCDLICRGVPSPKIWQAYLKNLQQQHASKIVGIRFKEKSIGWNQFTTAIVFANGDVHRADRREDDFMRGYLFSALYLRPSCYACQYRTVPRVGDLSLGDFWKIGRTRPHLDDNKGTSLVLVNTQKGNDLLDAVKNSLLLEKCTLQEAYSGNRHLTEDAARPSQLRRNKFFRSLGSEHDDV